MKYICEFCGREWDYPVESCIFCKNIVSEVEVIEYTVEEITQVFLPSDDHPIVPYYILLLKNSSGSYKFLKTFQRYNIGDTYYAKGRSKKRYTIGIIGTGVTGRGIAEIAVNTGNNIVLKSRSERTLKSAINMISYDLSKMLSPEELNLVLSRITTTTNFDMLSLCDFIIESVAEDVAIKTNIFNKLDSICDQDIILASNTSSLSISKLAKDTKHPERIVGMHFFNPISKMKLVEIVKGEKTSEDVLEKTNDLAIKFNKLPINVNDSPGFIVNRLLFIMINEACHMLDENVASIEDIDKAMKMGANYPMGPFELADLIGLDLCLDIIENLNNSLFKDDTFEPSNILKALVKTGNLGRKTGNGFYQY